LSQQGADIKNWLIGGMKLSGQNPAGRMVSSVIPVSLGRGNLNPHSILPARGGRGSREENKSLSGLGGGRTRKPYLPGSDGRGPSLTSSFRKRVQRDAISKGTRTRPPAFCKPEGGLRLEVEWGTAKSELFQSKKLGFGGKVACTVGGSWDKKEGLW